MKASAKRNAEAIQEFYNRCYGIMFLKEGEIQEVAEMFRVWKSDFKNFDEVHKALREMEEPLKKLLNIFRKWSK